MIEQIKDGMKKVVGSIIPFPEQVQHTQVAQVQLVNQYRLMKKLMSPSELPGLGEVGFQVYSQFEENGMLLYIFSIIGTTNKRVVEICAGDGIQCMAANLVINHGWTALLFDGDKPSVDRGNKFYAAHPATWLYPPIFKHAWITRENINELIINGGFKGEIDLLSLDLDGNDYHVMEAITAVQPRVIICETQNVIPSTISVTIPYKVDFDRKQNVHADFSGASLAAMNGFLTSRNYRLIGAHRHGFNAIFMLNDIAPDIFPAVSISSVHDNDYSRHRQSVTWNQIKDLPWQTV